VISTRIKYRVPVPGAGSGSADSTGSGTPGTSAGMQPATKLADVGEYRDRIMVAEMRARPGSEQQAPHRLAVRPLYETENADDHMPDAVEMTRLE
jgi:hypothetical protein